MSTRVSDSSQPKAHRMRSDGAAVQQPVRDGKFSQIRSRQRVRDLAEVYTHKREVDAMLDLVASEFPSADNPGNTDRKFLEPACGHGNFLEEILRRKLAFVTTQRYGRGERYEQRILRALASIYAVDICEDNVQESRERLRWVTHAHTDNDLNTKSVSDDFSSAVDVVLGTNIVCADALADAATIQFIDYAPKRSGRFLRTWSYLDSSGRDDDLFSLLPPRRDDEPVHYSQLADDPDPKRAGGR